VRVADDKRPQLDVTAVMTQIVGIWAKSKEESYVNFEREYDNVVELMESHRYKDANVRLDKILDMDEKQSRAWFYKSLLPILEKENVIYKGNSVNVVKLSRITNSGVVRQYLKNCGLKSWQVKPFLDYYRKTDFLFEQHMRYLDKAIENATNEERLAFLEEHKKKRIKWQKQRIRKRKFATFGWLLLLAMVVAGCGFALWWFVFKEGLFW